ncbi:MAG: MSHA biogenesis protein MshK [Betaproteobacteria bacterium]|nr:MSHA biogenesis protein MshK [Betaproteobacteria bacterium]
MAGVQAQALTDPTRPPSAGAGPSPGGEQEAAPASRLQSVLISSGRKLAVIDGMTVPLGGMVGEARLVRITETEVLLRTGKETEVLKLFPGIDKQPSGRGLARARLGSPGTKPPRNGESR